MPREGKKCKKKKKKVIWTSVKNDIIMGQEKMNWEE